MKSEYSVIVENLVPEYESQIKLLKNMLSIKDDMIDILQKHVEENKYQTDKMIEHYEKYIECLKR